MTAAPSDELQVSELANTLNQPAVNADTVFEETGMSDDTF